MPTVSQQPCAADLGTFLREARCIYRTSCKDRTSADYSALTGNLKLCRYAPYIRANKIIRKPLKIAMQRGACGVQRMSVLCAMSFQINCAARPKPRFIGFRLHHYTLTRGLWPRCQCNGLLDLCTKFQTQRRAECPIILGGMFCAVLTSSTMYAAVQMGSSGTPSLPKLDLE